MSYATLEPRYFRLRACPQPIAAAVDGVQEGLAWGFYNEVVPPPDRMTRASGFMAELAAGPTFAHAMTKRMLHQEWNLQKPVFEGRWPTCMR